MRRTRLRSPRWQFAPSVLLALGLTVAPAGRAQLLDVTGGAAPTVITTPSTYQAISVSDGGVLLVNAPLTVTGDLRVGPGGLVTMDAGVYVLSLAVGGTLRVELGGAIDTGGLGLPANTTIDPVTGKHVQARGGVASHCAPGADAADDATYDDPLDPRLPGAGGEESAGGGALLVTAGALHLDGILSASGQTDLGPSWNQSGGAAGAVNVLVGSFSGGGSVRAMGGEGSTSYGKPGAGGCVRIAYETSSFAGRFDVAAGDPAPERSAGTAILVRRGSGAVTAAAGVLRLRAGHRVRALGVAAGATLRLDGEAEVDEPLVVPAAATVHLASAGALGKVRLPLVEGTLRVDVDVASTVPLVLTGRLVLNRRLSLPSFEARTGAVVTHDLGVRTMHLDVEGLLAVESGARVDAAGLGLVASRTIDPVTGVERLGSVEPNGGSHGGLGGLADASNGRVVAPVYDDPLAPALPGGGGGGRAGECATGGSGGGVLRLSAGLLSLTGALVADGAPGHGGRWCGAGAGGSVVVRAGALEGTGHILARGHPVAAEVGEAGGGGGGLVLLALGESRYTGTVSAAGGPGRVAGQDGVVTQLTVPVAPRVVSTPTASAVSGATYAYVPRATGTPPLTWVLASGPAGATVDASSGALVWTPTALGDASFELVVTNQHGEDRQAFRLGVLGPAGGADARGPPRFLSTPDTAAHCDVPYRYSGEGAPVVAGAGPFTFAAEPSLGLSPPPGLHVDPATGAFTWTPSKRDVGANPIELRVVGAEGSTSQTFAIVVECATERRLGVGCGCAGGEAPTGPASLIALLAAALGARRHRRTRETSHRRLRSPLSTERVERPPLGWSADQFPVPAATADGSLRRVASSVRILGVPPARLRRSLLGHPSRFRPRPSRCGPLTCSTLQG